MATSLLLASGGLGLFLYGMLSLSQGLAALAGGAARRLLARSTRTPASGALTGMVATVLAQSSSVTTAAAVGFVSAGWLSFPGALGLVLGANVGSTSTGWLVALLGIRFDLGSFLLPLVLVGSLLRLFASRRWASLGSALAGFALLFYGTSLMRQALAGVEGALTPTDFPADTPLGRLALIGMGTLLSLVTRSSSAGVAAALTALHAGTIAFPQAGALVIGLDVGTTSTALLASVGGGAAARRTGFAHVFFNLLAGAVAYALLPAYGPAVERIAPGWIARSPELALVLFHTTFNLLGVLLVLPFVGPLARGIERWIPERGSSWLRPLDPALLEETELALGAVERTLADFAPHALSVVGARVDPAAGGAAETGALESLRDTVRGLGEYLDRIHVTAGKEDAARRHQTCMLVVDHLRRLVRRLERGAELGPQADDRTLGERERELALQLQGSGSGVEHASELRVLCRRLRQEEPTYRRAVLARAALGELEADEALERLDRMRSLRRVAGHAWRIAHHLARMRRPAPARGAP